MQPEEDPSRELIQLINIVGGLVVVILAANPELPQQMVYRLRLYLAHRERERPALMRWWRERARATGQTADRIIPAGEAE